MLAEALTALGFKLVSGGTDNHLLLVDCVSSLGINGKKMEKVCDLAGITLNKNTIPGDTNALVPSGVRIGLCAMTTRGCGDEGNTSDMGLIAKFLKRAGDIGVKVQEEKGKKAVDFERDLERNEEILQLKKDCAEWSVKFRYPGL